LWPLWIKVWRFLKKLKIELPGPGLLAQAYNSRLVIWTTVVQDLSK
jgi:hypothetical protein